MFAELRDALVPLVAATGDPDQPRNDGVFGGPFGVETQRAAVLELLDAVGYDPDHWRLDPSLHPFAQSLAPTDVRLTTKYDESDYAVALYSVLHEFGHGLYEASVDPSLVRTTLAEPVSLGVHESQSRLWENIVGRSRPFAAYLLPQLRRQFPGAFEDIDAVGLYRAVNTVQPSLIRIEADETTYNLHIILRFELELALIEGSLGVDDVPARLERRGAAAVRPRGPQRRRGRAAGHPLGRRADRLLPDLHDRQPDGGAAVGARCEADVPDVWERIEGGDFAALREWLRVNVHRHGRKLYPRELLPGSRARTLRVEPFVALPARQARGRRAAGPRLNLAQSGKRTPVRVLPSGRRRRIGWDVMSRQESIVVAGAREHNLKDVTVELPRDALVGDHGPVGLGQVLAGLRHDLRGGPAPLRRVAERVRAPVPGADGQARRGLDRGAVAGDLDRPEDDLAQPALDGRHGHGDLRLPAPAVGADRQAALLQLRPADRGPVGRADHRPDHGAWRRAPASWCWRRSCAGARASTASSSRSCAPRASRA